ncbi:hypothetical protein T492DRAFT_927340 [Pavlovales sp. CCMP2436]|nr:hypothetical protein T492DRAFT_927340 [Pavlovales sp. CCMP2436]
MSQLDASQGAQLACVGCRLSKVRCDLREGGGTCTRCGRLGLHCVRTVPGQRGRRKVSDVTNRLSLPIRALLLNQPDEERAPKRAKPTHQQLIHSPTAFPAVFGSGAPALYGFVLDAFLDEFCGELHAAAPSHVKMHVISQMFAIARRKADPWPLTMCVLDMARKMGCDVGETIIALSDVAKAPEGAVPLSVTDMPDYLNEWVRSPLIPVLFALESLPIPYASEVLQANEAMYSVLSACGGSESSDLKALSLHSNEPLDSLRHKEMWISIFTRASRAEISKVSAATLSQADLSGTSTHSQHVETRGKEPVYIVLNGFESPPLIFAVRMVVLPGRRGLMRCFALLPTAGVEGPPGSWLFTAQSTFNADSSAQARLPQPQRPQPPQPMRVTEEKSHDMVMIALTPLLDRAGLEQLSAAQAASNPPPDYMPPLPGYAPPFPDSTPPSSVTNPAERSNLDFSRMTAAADAAFKSGVLAGQQLAATQWQGAAEDAVEQFPAQGAAVREGGEELSIEHLDLEFGYALDAVLAEQLAMTLVNSR